MRRRLILTTAIITLIALLVVGVPLGIVQSKRARSDESSKLEREADGISAALEDSGVSGRPPIQSRLESLTRAGHLVEVVNGGSVIRAGSPIEGSAISSDSGADQGIRVTVSESADEVRQRQRDVWLLILGLVVVGTGAAAGLATIQARRLTRPIDRLVTTSNEMGDGDFSARTGQLDIPELDRVGQSLDLSAARIATLVGRQREFLSNVSHQLRSPLTALRLRLDALEAFGDDETSRKRELDAAQEATDRLSQTVDELMALARSGVAGTPRDIDLAELAGDHARRWEPVFAENHRRLMLDARFPVPAKVTPGGVAQALDVLIENGLRHGNGDVHVCTGSDEGGAYLAVFDEGEGIGMLEVPDLFQRDVSGGGSTGIGLSLARALVEADGGRLVLATARPARFEIRTPSIQPGDSFG